jgi:CheY-like chemotaxis protein
MEELQEIEAPLPDSIPTGTENLLFVDDEPTIVHAASEVLEALGYHVTGRSSSVEGLEAFRTQPDKFDLVITDLTMPQMTGTDLALKLHKIKPSVPLILCTGFGEAMPPQQAHGLGFRKVLMKPWTMRDLAQNIREALDSIN